jgi:hypothetical protein
MNDALGFSSTTFALGAGIFFLSYALLEIPSNIILTRVGARLWIARIIISWGIVSSTMMFVRSAPTFYAPYLLGAINDATYSFTLGLYAIAILLACGSMLVPAGTGQEEERRGRRDRRVRISLRFSAFFADSAFIVSHSLRKLRPFVHQ